MARGTTIAFAALIAAIGLRWWLDPWLGDYLPLSMLYGAVAVAVWAAGWRAALVVTLAGYFATDWLFIEPRHVIELRSARDVIGLASYLLSCAIIIVFGDAMRRANVRAISAMEDARREVGRRSQAENRFRMAAEAVNGVIYEYDFRSGQVARTRGLYEVLGWQPDEVPAEPQWWEEQVHPDDRADRHRQFAQGEAHGGQITMRYRIRHKDGRWLHVEDRAVLVMDEQGRRWKMHGCVVDVSDRMRAQRELEGANAELRDAHRRKDEFLATLAHELRNPLAPIRHAVRILQAKGPPDPDLMRSRAVIDRQVSHMARLLDDLLDVSRITRGKLELRKVRVTLAGVIDSAIETARPLIEAGQHHLDVRLPSQAVYLDGDTVRLAQVFSNLLTNAAKYTEAGGRIGIEAHIEGNEVAVSVRDTGIGISPEMHGRLFTMFAQAEPALERSQGGLGIGLALARGLVELHGGRIEARSEGPGRGSEFIVHLPIERLAQLEAATAPPSAHDPIARRVLVVDDNRDAADTLCTLLEVMGCEARVAYDGEEALRMAESFRPDIALLDLGMPRLNGYEACRRIRAQPWGERMCLIAVSGWGQDEDRRRTREAGFDAHLVKPVDPDLLANALTLVTQ